MFHFLLAVYFQDYTNERLHAVRIRILPRGSVQFEVRKGVGMGVMKHWAGGWALGRGQSVLGGGERVRWEGGVGGWHVGGGRATCVHSQSLPSFPGHSHLQYLIDYSMQIRRGKAWEIWSRAVMSGRQMVDTQGAVPDSSNCCFVSNRPWRCE